MKKLRYPTIALLFIGYCLNTSAQTGERKGWPSKDRYEFIRSCIETASPGLGEDKARYYCWCMQEKMEIKYPTIESASRLTEADINTPEWQKEIQGCRDHEGWSAKDRADFLSECKNAAKEGLGEEKATNYCECVLYKMERKYPKAEDAGEITEEKLNTPAFKKMMQDCLAF